MINFSGNIFYGLSIMYWLIIGIILLVILYIIFFYKKQSSDNFKNSTGTKAIIYNFNTSWCGWSTKFQPEWDNFTKEVESNSSLNNITCVDVKCDKPENEAKCKEFDVEGFPTVIIEMGDKVGTYKGERTAKELLATVKTL